MDVGAVILWWLLVVGLLGAALPLAAWLLPETPTAGSFLALPIGLLIVVIPTYWIGHLTFGVQTVFAGLAVLLAASVGLRRRGYRGRRRPALEAIAVFTAAFLFLLAIRAVDPGAHPGGGEKFLDHGLLQSLLRAERLPPPDMWFAGKRVVYYYGGHLVAATLAHLTDVPGRLAYNLALSTAYGGAVTAIYGLSGAIASARDLPRRITAGLGATFFGLASNLFVPVGAVGTLVSDELLMRLASSTGRTVEQATVTRETFGYWWSSRVIPGTITEFPLFAYLNGDLHAHMTDTIFLVLVAAIGFAYYQTSRQELSRRRLLIFGAAPPVIGYIGIVNTWSLPTAVGIVWLSLWLADSPPMDLIAGRDRWRPSHPVTCTLGSLGGATLLTLPIGTLALLWSGPYVLGILLGAGGSTINGIATVPEPTGLWALLVAHGTFLAPFTVYIVSELRNVEHRRYVVHVVIVLALASGILLDAPVLATVLPLGVLAWIVHQWTRASKTPGYEAVLLIAGVGLVTAVEFVYLNDAASGGRYNTVFKVYAQVWPLWSIGGAVALVTAVHRARRACKSRLRAAVPTMVAGLFVASLLLYGTFAFLEHFRPYIEIWHAQWWVGALVIGVAVLSGLLVRHRIETLPEWVGTGTGYGGQAVRRRPVFTVVLVLVLVLHGGIAGAALTSGGPADPSLDTLRFVSVWHPEEVTAIEWLADRSGQPFIVSAPGFEVYGWASPAASLTGLPTVIGWSHEANYRSLSAFERRVEDVDTLYRGSATQRAALLEKYQVQYIYVGPNERDRYDRSALAFADEPGISIAHQSGAVTVYAVDLEQIKTTVN